MKKDRFWWKDKTKKIKVESDNLEDLEDKLFKIYGLNSASEFILSKQKVKVRYGIKTKNGTWFVITEGKLRHIFSDFLRIAESYTYLQC